MLEKGLVQIYTGDGKGKTTASFGLALRAAGKGHKVFIYQFLKPGSLNTGERLALSRCSLDITVESLEIEWDMIKSFEDEQTKLRCRKLIAEAVEKITKYLVAKSYDVIILDEIVFCLSSGLASSEDVCKMIDEKHEQVELVLTGRGASDELIDKADLVSEIKNVKHPFASGITARDGIEY